jgi:Zn-dependent peptidase ImmA (M78 family)
VRLKRIFDLEARTIAEDFFKRVGWIPRSSGLPVTAIEIVALRAGYPVSTIAGLKANCDSYGTGFFNLQKNRYEILIDENSYENWQISAQFTIAEELGHLLAHWDYIKDFHTLAQRIAFETELDQNTFQIFEKQAKNVGSALLLPSQHFDPYIFNWAAQADLAKQYFPDAADLALHISQELSPKLDVSQQVVERALKRAAPTKLVDEIVTKLNLKLGRATLPPAK